MMSDQDEVNGFGEMEETKTVARREEFAPVRVEFDADKFAAQQVKLSRAMRAVAVAVTSPGEWVDLGGKPYLTAQGCDVFTNKFGISTSIVDRREERHTDADGEWIEYEFTVRASVIHPITQQKMTVEQMGNCNTRDPFFAKRDGKLLPLTEVDTSSVKKAALTNARSRAIKSVLGFHPSWDELHAAFGKSAEKVAAVQYGGKSVEKQATGKGVTTPLKMKIGKALMSMYGNAETAGQMLMKYTEWPEKNYRGVNSTKDLSDKQAPVTWGKVKADYIAWLIEQGLNPDEDELLQHEGDK